MRCSCGNELPDPTPKKYQEMVTRKIAEMMFHQTVTTYEDMPGGGPYRKVGDWKYKGRYAGEMVTLELVG